MGTRLFDNDFYTLGANSSLRNEGLSFHLDIFLCSSRFCTFVVSPGPNDILCTVSVISVQALSSVLMIAPTELMAKVSKRSMLVRTSYNLKLILLNKSANPIYNSARARCAPKHIFVPMLNGTMKRSSRMLIVPFSMRKWDGSRTSLGGKSSGD